jgi:hypothetical protein
MEYWMIGVLETIVADTFHKSTMGNRVGEAFLYFKTIPSIRDHYSTTPLLQKRRDLRAHVWPPLRGFQTKPRPLGMDSCRPLKIKKAKNPSNAGDRRE